MTGGSTGPTGRMRELHYSDAQLCGIFERTRTIAVVGASPKEGRPSHRVMAFLQSRGYRTIPVNPAAAGTQIRGETCVARLEDIDVPVDLVDVFRVSTAVPQIVESAIRIGAKAIWLQLGVRHYEAAARASAAGLSIVMDRCPAVELARLDTAAAMRVSPPA